MTLPTCGPIWVGRRITLIDSGIAGSETLIVAYLHRLGRRAEEIEQLFLTHSHPDHIGAAAALVALNGFRVAAHEAERTWIEDPARQAQERPVPGFASLVQGAVTVEWLLSDREELEIDGAPALTVLHAPGHAAGSLSLWAQSAGWLVSGDAVPAAGPAPRPAVGGGQPPGGTHLCRLSGHRLSKPSDKRASLSR